MTTENIQKRITHLNSLSRKSKKFRELSERLEEIIKSIPDFDRRDFLMESLTKVCTH